MSKKGTASIVQKRTRKPVGVNSITNTLKKIHGVLATVNTKETITASEKIELQISAILLNSLNENIKSILNKTVNNIVSTPVVDNTTTEEIEDEDDED